MSNNHSTTGYSFNKTGYTIDLVTRQITFQYSINEYTSDEIKFNFCLLCECGDNKQEEIKAMLAEEGITIETIETDNDYITVVVNAPLLDDIWETE